MTPMVNAAATIKGKENRSIPANAVPGCSVPTCATERLELPRLSAIRERLLLAGPSLSAPQDRKNISEPVLGTDAIELTGLD